MRNLLAVAALAAALLCAGDVKGTWSGQLDRPDGTKLMDVVLQLSQEGEAVTGSVGRAGDDSFPIDKAKLADNTLTFEVAAPEVKYSVKLEMDGDVLKGKVVATRDGQTSPDMPMTLKRSAR